MNNDQDNHPAATVSTAAAPGQARPSRRQILRGAGAGLGAAALGPVLGLGGSAAGASTRLTARASGRMTRFWRSSMR